jgi:ubiquinone/menaquinone biosynthesis C-methylase UbiE
VSRPVAPPPASPGRAEHYSYSVYADPAMAQQFEQARFGGPIGSLLAETQERVLIEFAGAGPGCRVVDVGTGTGRAAIALAARGAEVIGIDASREMLKVAEARAAESHVAVTFEVADAHHLPLDDRSVDVAVSLRVLMHTPDWRQCIGELCRVARARVVVDYPALASAATVQVIGRRVGRLAGRNVEAYRVFRHAAIRRELVANGFAVRALHRQFVLPIGFHKLIGSRAATERVEGWLARAGLLRLVGSPVTLVADRCASS